MMTKKHYIAIAETLNANGADLALVMDLADVFQRENDRFDRLRFLQASTIGIRTVAAAAPGRLDRAVGLA